MSIHDQRKRVRELLDDASPTDASTAYYALFHDPARSALFTEVDEAGHPVGFVGRFQTGIDLFRPLVTLHCENADCAARLLHLALQPDRPYILFAKLNQFPLVGGSLRIDSYRLLNIYRLDLRHFQPVMNVLVRQTTSHDGTPRAVIESGDQQAVAGVNWQSPAFAEVFVHTDAPARRLGWGVSVASAVSRAVVDGGRIPIYLVDGENEASRSLAAQLGYVDTGARQVYADVVYLGHPGE